MVNFKQNKRILVLGGTGLVGRNTVIALLKYGVRHLGVVGLSNDKGWEKLEEIEHYKIRKVKEYKCNLLLPSQFRQYLFKTVVTQGNYDNLSRILNLNRGKDQIRKEPLYKIIHNFRPDYIIDCVNIATQCAYLNKSSSTIKNIGIGYFLLLHYYQVLYYLLCWDFWKKEKIKVRKYIKIGTTGIGGMGFDILFTHGEEHPSLSLLTKVAMAGAQTNILFAMSNSRGIANIQEIIPATSIFQLSGFDTANKEIDGGESKGYALEEFRLLTDQKQMGVIDALELTKIIVVALRFNGSHYDSLNALKRSRVSSSSKSFSMRRKILQSWLNDLDRLRMVSVAHGNLGPQRVSKLLFEIFLVLGFYRKNKKSFWSISPLKIQKNIIAHISHESSLRKEIQQANLLVSTTTTRNLTTLDKCIDLTIKNITRWRKVLWTLGVQKKRKFLYAGNVLAHLIEYHHDLRKIP